MSANSSVNNKQRPLSSPSAVTVSVKGHLATKSSALATGNCKLERQFLTAQNMASHYKRVINAKSSIDASPPKSLVQSQKARDRARREFLRTSFQGGSGAGGGNSSARAQSVDTASESVSTEAPTSRTTTANTVRPTQSARTMRIDEMKPRPLPDRTKLNQQMADMMRQFTKPGHLSSRTVTYKPSAPPPAPSANVKGAPRADDNLFQMRASSSTSLRRGSSASGGGGGGSQLVFNGRNVSNMASSMSLRSSVAASSHGGGGGAHPSLAATSRLAAGHSYDVLENHADKFTQPKRPFEPRIINKDTATAAKSQLLQSASCYQAPRRRRSSRLEQSKQTLSGRDDDDEEKDNAAAADKSMQSVRNNNNNDDEIEDEKENGDEIIDDDDEMADDGEQLTSLRSSRQQQLLNESNRSIKFETERKTFKKEEELKYLIFLKQVTDEIIVRGITTNRAITNCFEYHIKISRDTNRLDETKMRELLATLRLDIGMPDQPTDLDIDDANYHATVRQALDMDKKRMAMIDDDDETINGTAHNYLTLKKFDWSSTTKANTSIMSAGSNTSLNDSTAAAASKRRQQQIKEANEYESELAKNIRLIYRRNSQENTQQQQQQLKELHDDDAHGTKQQTPPDDGDDDQYEVVGKAQAEAEEEEENNEAVTMMMSTMSMSASQRGKKSQANKQSDEKKLGSRTSLKSESRRSTTDLGGGRGGSVKGTNSKVNVNFDDDDDDNDGEFDVAMEEGDDDDDDAEEDEHAALRERSSGVGGEKVSLRNSDGQTRKEKEDDKAAAKTNEKVVVGDKDNDDDDAAAAAEEDSDDLRPMMMPSVAPRKSKQSQQQQQLQQKSLADEDDDFF